MWARDHIISSQLLGQDRHSLLFEITLVQAIGNQYATPTYVLLNSVRSFALIAPRVRVLMKLRRLIQATHVSLVHRLATHRIWS
jgi:hypothetical protein